MTNNNCVRIGLISDTHMPERCFHFPESLPEVFANVDFILHAGDVGELWVLDTLSDIAPVFAVHGNDDTLDAQRELPLQQIITIAGRRILLWHNHYPDRIDETTSRTDPLEPKFYRLVQRAQRAGATMVVFGHWHLPLVHTLAGVTMINPGTLELGDAGSRRLIQTVALLDLWEDGTETVTHVDLAKPTEPFISPVDVEAGFTQAASHFIQDIRDPEFLQDSGQLRKTLFSVLPEIYRMPFFQALNRAAHPAWLGERDYITMKDRIDAVQEAESLPAELRDQLVKIIRTAVTQD
ncbi:MAG: YfcE family phosphodiesterase [Chloroflexota bacterium]